MALLGTCFLFSGTPESTLVRACIEDIPNIPCKDPITLGLFAGLRRRKNTDLACESLQVLLQIKPSPGWPNLPAVAGLAHKTRFVHSLVVHNLSQEVFSDRSANRAIYFELR
jgi:hypothetical protein